MARQEHRLIGRVIKVGVEIRRAVIGVIGVGQAFPAEAQIEREPLVDAPIVHCIRVNCVEAYGNKILQLHLGEIVRIAQQEIPHPVVGSIPGELVISGDVGEDLGFGAIPDPAGQRAQISRKDHERGPAREEDHLEGGRNAPVAAAEAVAVERAGAEQRRAPGEVLASLDERVRLAHRA